MGGDEEGQVAGVEIERTKDDASGMIAGNGYLRLLSNKRITRA